MLDAQGRITIGKELLEKAFGNQWYKRVKLLLDLKNKGIQGIQVIPEDMEEDKDLYFIRTVSIDSKGRIFMPKVIINSFSGATYVPAMRDNKLYILII